jgi:hypothetical protein
MHGAPTVSTPAPTASAISVTGGCQTDVRPNMGKPT